MRAVLEITSEILHGHKRAIRAGQTLEVGRSSIVDFCVESDEQMSSRHFQLRTDTRGCYLEDFGSANGTTVNGEEVVAAVVLKDQDRICAGSTSFLIHLSGVDQSVTMAPVTPSASTKPAVAAMPRETNLKQLENEIFEWIGVVEAVAVEEIAKRLLSVGDGWSLLAVLDRSKHQPDSAVHHLEGRRLFQWLDEESTPETAPRVYQLDAKTLKSVVEQSWGKDAMVMAFWESEDEDPLPQLCRCAGAFARPSLIRANLAKCPPGPAKDMMLGLQAVLVESEDGERWSVYTVDDYSEVFGQMGVKVNSEIRNSDEVSAHPEVG
ncbi:MAG: FHA domain-containing protein [Planctomycetota bacterium]